MAEDIKAAGGQLELGDAVSVGWVHQGKPGIGGGVVPACLDLLGLVGDDRAAVHLAAGPGYGDDHAQGQGLEIHHAGPRPEIVPDVPIVSRCHGDGLAAVHDAAAADAQDHIHILLPCQSRALLDLGIGGVGHDAGELHHGLSSIGEDAGHFVIDAVALDGAAAVGQHHRIAVLADKEVQILLHTALSEEGFGGILENEIVHTLISPFDSVSFCGSADGFHNSRRK